MFRIGRISLFLSVSLLTLSLMMMMLMVMVTVMMTERSEGTAERRNDSYSERSDIHHKDVFYTHQTMVKRRSDKISVVGKSIKKL